MDIPAPSPPGSSLAQPLPSTLSPKRPWLQGICPGGSPCSLAQEPGSEESGLALQLVLRRPGILVGHCSQTRGLQVRADHGSSSSSRCWVTATLSHLVQANIKVGGLLLHPSSLSQKQKQLQLSLEAPVITLRAV